MQLTYITDPGHGWIACPADLALQLHIVDRISPYSYIDGDTFWLEEDCDAGILIDALRAANLHFEITERYVDHTHIRDLPRVNNPNWRSPTW